MEGDLQDQIAILVELQRVTHETTSLTSQGSGPALAGKRPNVPIVYNPSRLNKPRPQSIVDLRDVQRTRASDTGETNLHPSVGCSCNRMEEEPIDFDSEPCPMDEDIDVLRKQLEAEIPTDVDSHGSPRIPTDDVTEWHQRKQALETNWSKARSSCARTYISSQRRSSLRSRGVTHFRQSATTLPFNTTHPTAVEVSNFGVINICKLPRFVEKIFKLRH